jgi:MbtH protein
MKDEKPYDFPMNKVREQLYTVVVNHEEQYSIWAIPGQPIPNGWRAVGKEGNKETCLEYVKEVWTDMTPLSLRSTGTE